jgi:endonuclease YncB( thermonuclease family)
MNNRRYFYRRRPLPLWRVFGDAMLATIIFGLISAAIVPLMGTEVKSSAGQVRVIDGDSLRIGTQEIRLWGIDAPEFKQECRSRQGNYPCGREAQKQLRILVQDVALTCKGLGRDKYDRLLAVCRAGKTNINAALVRAGFAYAYGGYSAEESVARNAGSGIWATNNERPKAYRDRNKAEIDIAPGMLDALYQWLTGLMV